MKRSQEIIGDRTPEEEKYDNEVIVCLKKYGKIHKAINRANKKYPEEALMYNDENIADIKSHYEYLMEHVEIVKKISIINQA